MDLTTTESARISKSALFTQLAYSPHPGQIPVHKSKAKRRFLVTGARWGKTLLGAMEACAALLEPCEGSLGWTVAPSKDLVDRTFVRVADTMRNRFAHRIIDLDMKAQRISISNLGGGRSELRGKSADVPVNLLGERLSYVIIDEAAKLKAEVWERHVAQRLIDLDGWVLMLSTPNACNWFQALHRLARTGRDPHGEAWASPSWENPHLNKELIEAERARLPSDVFAQEYGAIFLGEDKLPCLRCGNDFTGTEEYLFWFDVAGRGRCPECGGYVHEDGVSMESRPGSNMWYEPKVGVIAPGDG